MICPSCLAEVDKFDAQFPHKDKPGYRCPLCKEPVPENYIADYQEYPPITFFLMGLPGHGKSLYTARLFVEFETVGRKWLEFFYTPIQERFLEAIRVRQQALEKGKIPESTRRLFTKPAVVRLDGVPGLGKCQLLMYDFPAEAEPDPRDMRFLNGYIGRNQVIVFMLSLQDIDSPADLTDFLTRFKEMVSQTGHSTSEQTLIVVLTKGDRLLGMKDLPDYIRKSILGEYSSADEEKDVLCELSGIIEAWLGTRQETMNFVRRANAEFKEVRYTTTVAMIEEDEATAAHPSIGVWWPLRLAWKTQQPLLKEAQRREVKKRIGRAAKDSASEISRRILGGSLGLIEGALWGALLWALAGGFEGYINKFAPNEILHSAIKQGGWGIIWGAIIWAIAGMTDAVRNTGSHTRAGVRIGAVVWFIGNGLIAGVIWGLTLSAFAMLKEDAAFSTSLLTGNALIGVAVGARIGALLGALWGLTVRSVSDEEIRDPSGAAWSLLVASLVSVLVYLLAGLNPLYTNLVWGGMAVMIFLLWSGIKR